MNEYGQIIMSPASNERGRLKARIGALLGQRIHDGEVIFGSSIDTPKGIKVADVAWVSPHF